MKVNLTEIILSKFSEKPLWSPMDLLVSVNKAKRKYSKQALFKALKLMIKKEVITKRGKAYCISYNWIIRSKSALEKIELNCLSNEYLELELPKSGKNKIFNFNNALTMKKFWSHLVLLLLNISSEKIIYSWNPHPWFYLLLGEHEAQVVNGIGKSKARMFKLVGGVTTLDRQAAHFWKDKPIRYKFNIRNVNLKAREYHSIIDNYLVTIRFTKSTADKINLIYNKYPYSQVEEARQELFRVLSQCDSRLEITAKPQRITKFKSVFKSIFQPQ